MSVEYDAGASSKQLAWLTNSISQPLKLTNGGVVLGGKASFPKLLNYSIYDVILNVTFLVNLR